jgi:hypothetical protein
MITTEFGRGFRAGSGCIMADPDNPTPAPESVFGPQDDHGKMTAPAPRTPVSHYSFRYVYNSEAERFSQTLHTNFKGTFGFGSVAAAADYVRTRSRDYTMVILLMEKQIADVPLGSLQWTKIPISEAAPPEECLEQFVRTYGSHYVVSAIGGYRAAFRAEVLGTTDTIQRSFSVAVEGLGNGWSAGGGASGSSVQSFKSIHATIEGSITAGDVQRLRV